MVEVIQPEFSKRDASRDQVTEQSVRFISVLVIILELGLILFTAFKFQIEKDQGFLVLLPLVFAGFLIHLSLPARFRLPLLFALSVFAILTILGAKNGAIAIGIGLTFVAVCHLPVSRYIKAILLLVAAVMLACARSGWIAPEFGRNVVPLIASMFMFRLILYFFELKQKTPVAASIWHRLSYFFLLPNSCFLLFPIIDYKTFITCYSAEIRIRLLQKGINLLALGVLQLILYRIIYYYWIPAPSEVIDLRSLAVYLTTSYMVVLRICGQFYLSIGIVCLFGFDLPPLFQRYLLATGFSDFWRRLNTYWKDFMTKMFYYRIYFRFKEAGILTATVASLAFVFFLTWLFHSYQFFWVKGKFPVTAVDALFWGIFGLFVIVDSVIQMKAWKKKSLTPQWSFKEALQKSARWLSFFLIMCLLWSLLASASVSEWVDTIGVIRNTSGVAVIYAILILCSTMVAGALFQNRKLQFSILSNEAPRRSAISITLCFVGILIIRLYTPSNLMTFIADIQEPRLNKRDQSIQLRGYYEPLLNRANFIAEVPGEETTNPKKLDDIFQKNDRTNDIRSETFFPNTNYPMAGMNYKTNRWGMVDKDYELEKPPNTYRFALLGGSIEMGSGVSYEARFETLVENRLNSILGNKHKIEILNFSHPAYTLIQNVKVCESDALRFKPDAVLLFVHPAEEYLMISKFPNMMKTNFSQEYPELRNLLRQSGISEGLDYSELSRRIHPYIPKIHDWALARISSACRSNHAVPVWLFLSSRPSSENPRQLKYWQDMIVKHGYLKMDLSGAFRDRDRLSLQLGPGNIHPNAEGHRLIAECLYKLLIEHRYELHF